MIKYIDTHIHLYDDAYKDDLEKVIRDSFESGVACMLQPDIDSTEREKMIKISEKYPGKIYSMAGLYPGSVTEDWEKEIEKLHEHLNMNEAVAIGEIGLDYHYGKENAALQKIVLKLQLELASQKNLPVNIHLREASEDFVSVLKECRHLNLRGNLHAFSISFETFSEISKYGEWNAGIGGVVTFKNSKLPETVKKIPLENIVLETDGPYLTPAPFRGKRNESKYLHLIAKAIAELKNKDIEEVAFVTSNNAIKLFNLKNLSL